MPNKLDGIWVKFAQCTYIAGNTVSGNDRYGIYLNKSKGSTLQFNWIGTNQNGAELPNGSDGIRIGDQGADVRSFGDKIGGALSFNQSCCIADGNIIQFNKGNGIKTHGFVENDSIQGNTISNNGQNGILIGPFAREFNVGGFKTPGNQRIVGSVASGFNVSQGPLGTSNLIENNGGDGIKVVCSHHNELQSNLIDSNNGAGIEIINSSKNLIGVPDAANSTLPQPFGNTINNNNGAGVAIVQECKKADDNAILSNSIFDNVQDGIQLIK